MVVARIHDNLTPHLAAGWKSITVTWKGGRRPMRWYGENLYYSDVPRGARGIEVCATDVAGNRTCERAE